MVVRSSELVATGVRKHRKCRIVCSFDPEVFEQLRLIAQREGTSLAEQVRLLVEIGIEWDAG